MSAGTPSHAAARVLEREAAATEERHWVRLTRRCNNRCLFCHDTGRHDGTAVGLDELAAELRAGRDRGATRLVLSGGEPTIHPRFVEVVALGRQAGFRWIQVVSNGRIFAYERFTAEATAAGLDEATLSIHGHTPELHDAIVGAPGAFAQVLRGLRNLRRAGRVVSVDVVVCRPNVRHLGDLLRLLLGLGVREFDLLHLIPFGRAHEEQRAALEYDPLVERPYLLDALGLAARPGVHVWTNRWPAALLEGAEHLIQDPHKLLDDLQGMKDELRGLLERGEILECAGDRCRRCFMERFCRALGEARGRLVRGEFEVVTLDAGASELTAGARAALDRQGRARLRVRARDVGGAVATLARSPRGATAEIELEVDELAEVPPALAARLRRVVIRRLEELEVALRLPGVELEVPLGRATAAIARRAVASAAERVVLRAAGRALLSETVAEDLPPADLAELVGHVRAEGIPPCVAPGAAPARSVLDAAALDPEGRLDLFPFAERWLRDGCRTRSLRCGTCAARDRCDGAPVNAVRAHGYGWMRPQAARG